MTAVTVITMTEDQLADALTQAAAKGAVIALKAVAPSGPKWLTVDQAAERMGCTPQTIRRKCRNGHVETMPGVRPWRIAAGCLC